MSLYRIEYQLEGDEKSHARYYQALTKDTALNMFEETANCGSLTGERPKNIRASKMEPKIKINKK